MRKKKRMIDTGKRDNYFSTNIFIVALQFKMDRQRKMFLYNVKKVGGKVDYWIDHNLNIYFSRMGQTKELDRMWENITKIRILTEFQQIHYPVYRNKRVPTKFE